MRFAAFLHSGHRFFSPTYDLHTNRVLGGSDIFVDIGDKSWGVLACQEYLGGIEGSKTLHIGDQFLSAGANDFKVCRNFSIS